MTLSLVSRIYLTLLTAKVLCSVSYIQERRKKSQFHKLVSLHMSEELKQEKQQQSFNRSRNFSSERECFVTDR
jgi:hypothetical protein